MLKENTVNNNIISPYSLLGSQLWQFLAQSCRSMAAKGMVVVVQCGARKREITCDLGAFTSSGSRVFIPWKFWFFVYGKSYFFHEKLNLPLNFKFFRGILVFCPSVHSSSSPLRVRFLPHRSCALLHLCLRCSRALLRVRCSSLLRRCHFLSLRWRHSSPLIFLLLLSMLFYLFITSLF